MRERESGGAIVIFVSCNEKFLVADAAAEEEEKKRERKTGREKVEGKKKKRVEVRKKGSLLLSRDASPLFLRAALGQISLGLSALISLS